MKPCIMLYTGSQTGVACIVLSVSIRARKLVKWVFAKYYKHYDRVMQFLLSLSDSKVITKQQINLIYFTKYAAKI